MISVLTRGEIYKRSYGRCEAIITVMAWDREYTGRCRNRATEIHHRLTKARGGDLLDKVGETYHLIHLCPSCHRASDGAQAYLDAMLIEGSVTWDKLYDRPMYVGPDEYLSKRYA